MKNTIKINVEKSKLNSVVIIGGGFAGTRAALDLLKNSNGNVHVTLIDKNFYHSYHPDYYEVATAVCENLRECGIYDLTLRSTVAVPFEKIFKNFKNITVIHDEVCGADFDAETVKTKHKKEFLYDWLVVSGGSETSFYDIPKLKDLSLELKSVNDALNIRNVIDELMGSKGKRDFIQIVIGGGGFSGCELVGEIVGYIIHLLKIHKLPRENVKIKIIEASDVILKGVSVWAQKKTEARLKKLGVEILTNFKISRIESIEQAESYLSNKQKGRIFWNGSESLDFDILIWTGGVEASSISKLFKNEGREKKFCLKTNANLLIPPHKNIFAAGDIAYYLDYNTNSPLLMTAQTAISQGRYIASAILSKIKKEKIKNYKPKHSQFIIPLGGKYAIADLKIFKFSGIFAWALKHFISLHYFSTILPLKEAIKLWLKGMKMYVRND